ncbi:hypothetical protein FKW77_003905 [Venturia effusa]|uniref:C2H2-type domain-containing protein n=1 Tax=Venturia effusa TaxID=50376 RepID=A0A517LAT4_9PEZI|nr:hypothetical protein FKW77_003905 [Venturia effusa]
MSSQASDLSSAINNASKEQLQRVLNAILQIHPETASTASSLLETQDLNTSANHPKASDPGNQSPKKRKRLELCAQCKQEYDIAKNNPKACTWHRGVIEANDESDAGPHSLELVEQFPEAYFWDCCEKSGADTTGCVVSEHSMISKFVRK